ncbi:MAG: porphobilinogen synthase [Opitutae bacterium]|nr:porphobilinogen synthase [Opitutae bacterium]MBC9890250.1 porphobilinogen synthase [Opitutae bacterium]
MNPHFELHLPRRPRRLRRSPAIRNLVEETTLTVNDLVAPLFVKDGFGPSESIASMPDQFRLNMDDLLRECEALLTLGVEAVGLFPQVDPGLKNSKATEATNEDNLVLRSVRLVKETFPDLVVITDVALDPYTDHGHDGVLDESGREVLNDPTVGILCQMAKQQAEAGVDFVAPSDMMDGRIGAIRDALDDAGHTHTSILAYSAKFASAYYGPFREAIGSAQAAGTHLLDKRTYQLNPANRREASLENQLDAAEGADILMVKPAGPYLDIIRDLRNNTELPIAAYQVSGEYSQIQAAAKLSWLDLEKCRDESLLSIKRAGADIILTYFAKAVAASL